MSDPVAPSSAWIDEVIRVVAFDPAPGVADPDRLQSLELTGLCDTEPEESFDEITGLIIDLLDVPVALVSLVDGVRQFFKAQRGLPEPTASARETPLTHSFCQYVVAGDVPLVIEDARRDPVLVSNGAVDDLGVIAYAGFPIYGPGGRAIGSLCAIDSGPRAWTPTELALMARLARVVSSLVAVRSRRLHVDDRQATIQQLVESQEAERGRVAAELHDDTLQVLSALSIRLQLLARGAPTDVADQVDELVGTVAHASRRIRRFVTDLRPDTLGSQPLAVVLGEHLEWLRENHPSLTVTLIAADNSVEPGHVAAVTLFRIAQQAVANAITHGRPDVVTVELRTVRDTIELAVTDDGAGFDQSNDVPAGHYGLTVMRERAHAVGGTLRIVSAPGTGTVVTASVPARTAS